MTLGENLLLVLAPLIPLAAAARAFYALRNTRRDPTKPGWRVVTHQFGRELRTKAMPKERALNLASRLIYGAVKVVRLDNDADGTTITLAEIRDFMENKSRGA